MSVVEDLNEYIIGLILPTECIKCYVARLTSNPFLAEYNKTVILQPCKDACDFCLRENKCKSAKPAFPKLNKEGVHFSFADTCHGLENEIVDMEITVELIQKIRQYPQVNKTFYI